MGKSIKFFKKLTSLVLAGLTIFSSVPVKAWKEEDPRHAVQAEIDKLLAEGYKKITAQDVNEQLEYAMNASWWDDYDEKLDVGKIIADFCSRKHIDYAKVISIDFIPFFLKGYTNNNFYVESLSRFKNLINFNMNCENMQLSAYAFMNNTNLKLVDFSGSYTSSNLDFFTCKTKCFIRERYIRNGGWYRGTYGKLRFATLGGNNENTYEEKIDLFSSCIYPVTLICSSNIERNFFIDFMGDKGKRHKVLSAEYFDEANREPLKLDKSTEVITLESTNQVRTEIAQFNESKNIVIPKHVKKIEKDAFKNAGLCGVTFEEGMTEIEFCDGCFAGCPLVKFELPKSLKKIVLGKNCFAGCPNELYIENYVRGEIERIEKEKEAEKQRVRDEVKKAADYIIDRQAKEKAAYLKKIKEENEQRIKKRKEEIKEAIKVLEENKLKAVGAQEERQKDLDEKIKVDTSSMNEVEIKIFNAEKAMLEAKLEAANSNLELINTNLKCKNEILQELENGLKELEIKVDFEKLLADIEKREAELKKMLDEIKEKIKTAEGKEKSNKEEAERLATIAKEQAEKAAEQERTDKRQDEEQKKLNERQKKLNEEQQKFKKEKIFWDIGKFLAKSALTLSPFVPFIPVVGPIITSVVQPIITSSVSAVTSIVGLVANLTVDICKSLFTSKSKKEVHQKPSNSASNTSATPV